MHPLQSSFQDPFTFLPSSLHVSNISGYSSSFKDRSTSFFKYAPISKLFQFNPSGLLFLFPDLFINSSSSFQVSFQISSSFVKDASQFTQFLPQVKSDVPSRIWIAVFTNAQILPDNSLTSLQSTYIFKLDQIIYNLVLIFKNLTPG